ncbi:cyclin-like protein [Microdochium trichocladiopsis]|uniref:Cyclin-like protein n=1 Tax=Microdochium trichocladiopsis TaxID=1682393 RepID=A0A9P8Y922_9PEZI|nr:cyclin-like protein [Microdochium trichocladiopsis]KAH7033213.1 cyclin-like protein [Microdochium trichocladiopsis]
MDAKPARRVRAVPSLGNENLSIVPKQTIHHRHKSTGNLLNMPTTGSLRMAAKRTALADFSNINRQAPAESGKGLIKQKSAATFTVLKGKENQSSRDSNKDQPAKSAHRQPQKYASAANLRHHARFSGVSSTRTSDLSQVVARELPSAAVIEEKPEVPSNVELVPLDEYVAASHYDEPASVYPELEQDFRFPTSNAVPAVHEHPDVSYNSYFSGSSSDTAPESNPLVDNAGPEDDQVEALYVDAVEEFPAVPATEAHGSAEVRVHIADSIATTLHHAIAVDEKPHAKFVDAEPHPILSYPDDAVEVSDYDDEAYGDDQGYMTAHSYRSHGDNTTTAFPVMFPPKLGRRGQAELEAAKQYVDAHRTKEEEDEECWDVSMVAEYGDDIFAYCRELELQMLPNANYMDTQTEIQWSMRSVLMDWVIQVHTRFGLLPETLFLTVNYIDRFLTAKIVSLGKLQLVGATALFLAAKYEEINCPSVQEIAYMVDHGYTVEEILKAERFMLSMLNFEMGWPGPMSFLRRISKADDYDLESRTLSKYLLEVAIMDERFVASPASYLAAGAHCLSRLILGKGEWTKSHVYYSQYTFAQLKPLISTILDCCRIARKHHVAVFEKYSDRRYKRAATFVETQLNKGFTLPFQQSIGYRTSQEFPGLDLLQESTSHSHSLKMSIPVQG